MAKERFPSIFWQIYVKNAAAKVPSVMVGRECGRQNETQGGREHVFVPFLLPLILFSDSRDRRFEAQLRAAELGREAAQGRRNSSNTSAQTDRQTRKRLLA